MSVAVGDLLPNGWWVTNVGAAGGGVGNCIHRIWCGIFMEISHDDRVMAQIGE